jgi:signal transduction histidine kinase
VVKTLSLDAWNEAREWARASLGEVCVWPDECDRLTQRVDLACSRQEEESRDVELRSMERRFRSRKLASLRSMAGVVAHDFNNILQGILGNADLASMSLPPRSPVRETLRHIEKAADQGVELTRQLLGFSGRKRVNLEPVDISKVVTSAISMAGPLLSRRISLSTDLQDSLPLMKGDAPEIRQMLLQLLTNAASAAPQTGGKVRVETGLLEKGEDLKGTLFLEDFLPDGPYVYLRVWDNGGSLTSEIEERLFEPFFTTREGARGLGLAAVLGAVRAHHAFIQIESKVGEGTRFTIFFSAIPAGVVEAEPSAMTRAASAAREGKGSLVLVVDDQVPVRNVLSGMLTSLGHRVIAAGDGREALDLLVLNPDTRLVILDFTMPQMGGLETLREIRKKWNNLPVVLTSGYGEAEIGEEFAGLEPNGFLQKPFSLKDLEATLRQLK